MDELKQSGKRKASFGATMKAVFWSFMGIRKRSDYEHDSANLNPVHVIVAALIGVLIFIGVLVMVVKFVVAK
jgi:amino acid transporter